MSCKEAKYTNISVVTAGLKTTLRQNISLQDAPAGFQHMNVTDNQGSNP